MFTFNDIISVPFGYVMDFLNRFVNNYGVAVMLFSVIVCGLMYPLRLKGTIDSVKKRRLAGHITQIRKMYPGNQDAQNTIILNMYDKEKVNLLSSFLLNILPFFILIMLFAAVRQPLVYTLHMGKETANEVVAYLKTANPDAFRTGYPQVIASQLIPAHADELKAMFPELTDRMLQGLNYKFLGLDLAQTPNLNFSTWNSVSWSNIGLCLLPFAAVFANILPRIIPAIKKVVKRFKAGGVEEGVTEKKFDLFTPLLMLLFTFACFQVPGALSLYWLTNSILNQVLFIFIKRKVKALPAPVTVTELVKEYNASQKEKESKKAD